MTQSAAQWAAFAREVAKNRKVWTVRDDGGYPAPVNGDGERVQPFWSSPARAERIIKTIPSYGGFRVVELSWEEFRDRWLPGLHRDGLLVGVNWTGKGATGYDIAPEDVRKRIEWEIDAFE